LEAHPLEEGGEAEVARLLKHSGACRVRCATGEVDAPAANLDEEEHIEATQRDRLDGEKVAGEQARSLAAQRRRPVHRATLWRGLEPVEASRRRIVLGEIWNPSLIGSPAIR
jgi:hypothetical protein